MSERETSITQAERDLLLPARRTGYETVIRELGRWPEKAQPFKWEAIGYDPKNPMKPRPGQGTLLTGTIPSVHFLAGKRKGSVNWKASVKENGEFKAVISDDEYKAWLAKWEAEENRCHKCEGTGHQAWGWSVAQGSYYKICTRCGGTGKPPLPTSATEIAA